MANQSYEYGGARALVALHAEHLREFVATWQRADRQALELPVSTDPSYASRELLLAHVLGCAARYLTWLCENLGLARPEVEEFPDASAVARHPEEYLEAVLRAWEHPLRGLKEEVADTSVYDSRWGVPYCIDAMLEHAVMHPIRHRHQLENLLADG